MPGGLREFARAAAATWFGRNPRRSWRWGCRGRGPSWVCAACTW